MRRLIRYIYKIYIIKNGTAAGGDEYTLNSVLNYLGSSYIDEVIPLQQAGFRLFRSTNNKNSYIESLYVRYFACGYSAAEYGASVLLNNQVMIQRKYTIIHPTEPLYQDHLLWIGFLCKAKSFQVSEEK